MYVVSDLVEKLKIFWKVKLLFKCGFSFLKINFLLRLWKHSYTKCTHTLLLILVFNSIFVFFFIFPLIIYMYTCTSYPNRKYFIFNRNALNLVTFETNIWFFFKIFFYLVLSCLFSCITLKIHPRYLCHSFFNLFDLWYNFSSSS